MCIHTYIYIYIHIIYIYICISHVHVHICVYMYICNMYIYIYIFICIYTLLTILGRRIFVCASADRGAQPDATRCRPSRMNSTRAPSYSNSDSIAVNMKSIIVPHSVMLTYEIGMDSPTPPMNNRSLLRDIAVRDDRGWGWAG